MFPFFKVAVSIFASNLLTVARVPFSSMKNTPEAPPIESKRFSVPVLSK